MLCGKAKREGRAKRAQRTSQQLSAFSPHGPHSAGLATHHAACTWRQPLAYLCLVLAGRTEHSLQQSARLHHCPHTVPAPHISCMEARREQGEGQERPMIGWIGRGNCKIEAPAGLALAPGEHSNSKQHIHSTALGQQQYPNCTRPHQCAGAVAPPWLPGTPPLASSAARASMSLACACSNRWLCRSRCCSRAALRASSFSSLALLGLQGASSGHRKAAPGGSNKGH